MTRKKVTLAFIANDADRKTSFKKRKRGLIKKVSELSTVCGVDACAIIYSSYDDEPVVWPSHQEVRRVLAKFQQMPESEQNKKMANQDSFTRERIKKAEEQLNKLQKENRRKQIGHIITQCLGGVNYQIFNMVDLMDMGYVLNQTLSEINLRIDALKLNNLPQGTIAGNFHIGESSNAGNIAGDNVAQTVQGTIQEVPRTDGQGAIGWEDSLLPFHFNDGAPGPSNF